ncbi:hypothetical protein AURDEDRAFT_162084 [Auricularia subglabra TFB-10046 SS5]|nr:hypothetical protein AURDEDRAFT_162084 [Auricularia subglabra TFB-10046 SS5]
MALELLHALADLHQLTLPALRLSKLPRLSAAEKRHGPLKIFKPRPSSLPTFASVALAAAYLQVSARLPYFIPLDARAVGQSGANTAQRSTLSGGDYHPPPRLDDDSVRSALRIYVLLVPTVHNLLNLELSLFTPSAEFTVRHLSAVKYGV